MKNSIYFVSLLFICFLIHENKVLGQTTSGKLGIKMANSTLMDVYDSIKLCKWKDDAGTFINFSFDDNLKSHKEISKIFDSYNFKATFFVNSNWMLVDSLQNISARGHEIGSHTFSHDNFSIIDSTNIDFQIRIGKEMIENTLGVKCVSFTEAYHITTPLSKFIAQKYHLFSRDYSEYFDHVYFELNSSSTFNTIMSYINLAIVKRQALFLTAHGIDGDGYSPISKAFLNQLLSSVKNSSDNGEIWVANIREGVLYENLYREIVIKKSMVNDTVKIYFGNYNKYKYKDTESSPISIEIPIDNKIELTCLTPQVQIRNLINRYVFTTDLKRDTTLTFLMKDSGTSTGITSSKSDDLFKIYPNPVGGIVNLVGADIIKSVQIYNMEGELLFNLSDGQTQVDVSQLSKGCYLIKINIEKNNSTMVRRAKFLKI